MLLDVLIMIFYHHSTTDFIFCCLYKLQNTLKFSFQPSEYVLNVLRKVRSSELDESLLVLPFHYVIDLLKLLDLWLAARLSVELCCRCTFYLLRSVVVINFSTWSQLRDRILYSDFTCFPLNARATRVLV